MIRLRQAKWVSVYEGFIKNAPTPDELWLSLRDSSLHIPKPVRFVIDQGDSVPITLEAAISALRAVYPVQQVTQSGIRNVGPVEHHDIEFEGWIIQSGFSPLDPIVFLRGALLSAGSSPEVESCRLELTQPISCLARLLRRHSSATLDVRN